MPTDYDSYALQRLIDQLNSYEGRGTELVSVYVPPETPVSDVSATLSAESGEAANIKSKRTRTRVQDALKSLRSRLKYYETPPDNGLAMFSGVIDDDSGTPSHETIVIDEVPRPIETFRYHCDSEFLTEPLAEMLDDGETYGLLVLDKRDARVGLLNGSRVEERAHIESLVPGKHKAGGQSQQRFERRRLDAANEFYKKVADIAYAEFGDCRHDLAGLLVGGPSPTKDEFLNGDYLHHELQSAIIAVLDVSDTTENGLTELLTRGADHIEDTRIAGQRRLLEEFFRELQTDGTVTYGETNTRRALKYGAVDTAILSENVDGDTIDEFVALAEQRGSEVELVSTGFEQGAQLWQAFDGVAAILRYDFDAN